MKKFSFYWNWLARVAKSNNTQRKTAILAIAVVVFTALTTQNHRAVSAINRHTESA